jgi:dienelactone hydrolase family protein
MNFPAVMLGADLKAAVPFYGAAAERARVPDIKAPLLIQYAESDERVNALWPAAAAALEALLSVTGPAPRTGPWRRTARSRRSACGAGRRG